MTTLTVYCPDCGGVELWPTECSLRLVPDTMGFAIALKCPVCEEPRSMPVPEPKIEKVFQQDSMTLYLWTDPAEAFEVHDGPPIGYDDLLEFHNQLVALGSGPEA